MYELYLNDMVLPIAPQKIQIKSSGQNTTASLINGEEINIIKAPGLRDISFDAVLPQAPYPFAVYGEGFVGAEEFLDGIEALRESRMPFPFIVIRKGPAGSFHDTNLLVTLEDYQVTDDVKEGFDVTVSFDMKEYRSYGTKKVDFVIKDEETIVSQEEEERAADPPAVPNPYRVEKGDNLWNIAKRLLGSGIRYKEIYELNRDIIRNPNLIYPNQLLTMPPR